MDTKHYDALAGDSIDTDALKVGDTLNLASESQSDYINSLLAERGLKLCRADGEWLGVWPIGARHSHGGRKTGKLSYAHDCKICSLPKGR